MMGFNVLAARIAGVVIALAPTVAVADGEVDYSADRCGGPHGSPPPQFSTLVDLPVLFAQIGVYTLDPSQIYDDPWTNCYYEIVCSMQLANLATVRTILEGNNLWDTYRFASPATTTCPANAKTNRTINGTCNDLTKTWMGSAGARFGRNMDPTGSFAQAEGPTLMSPN